MHAANTIKTFSANFISKMYHHAYKSTKRTENRGKVLRFQSERWNKMYVSSWYQYYFVYKRSLNMYSFKCKRNSISVMSSATRQTDMQREKERERDRGRERERENERS